MGTRNLVCVWLDGDWKVAQYGQWDGYPSGVGLDVLNWLKGADMVKFRENLAKCTYSTDEEIKALWKECGADGSGWVNMDISDRFKEKWPSLNRDAGADILPMIEGSPVALRLAIGFAAHSLFCEWAYVVDLDAGVFEVYEGFNKATPEGRFNTAEFLALASDGYQPVTLRHSWDLDLLPTEEDFLDTADPARD